MATGLALAAATMTAAGCSSSGNGSSSSSSNLSGTVNGSGSTFQVPFQQQAIQEFKSIHSGITVNYGGGGSGKGRTDLASGVVNYAGSDSPIPPSEQSGFSGKTVLYFPVVIAPITISYNLPGVSTLKLSGKVIAAIFQANITTWNNPAIAAENPGVKLPATPIVIARRSDSSGTTQNFTTFLTKSAGTIWKLGTNSTISWPATSRGGNGNGGVASIVKSTAGAIGYVDYPDAKAAGLTFAQVQNSAGNFVAPSQSSASAAAANVPVASNLTFSAIDAPGANSYPITYQSWDLVVQSQSSNMAKLLKAYIGYLVGSGQKLLPALGYTPLPSSLQSKAQAQVNKIGT
jgi:phosphate transport system substrate-binding protein